MFFRPNRLGAFQHERLQLVPGCGQGEWRRERLISTCRHLTAGLPSYGVQRASPQYWAATDQEQQMGGGRLAAGRQAGGCRFEMALGSCALAPPDNAKR